MEKIIPLLKFLIYKNYNKKRIINIIKAYKKYIESNKRFDEFKEDKHLRAPSGAKNSDGEGIGGQWVKMSQIANRDDPEVKAALEKNDADEELKENFEKAIQNNDEEAIDSMYQKAIEEAETERRGPDGEPDYSMVQNMTDTYVRMKRLGIYKMAGDEPSAYKLRTEAPPKRTIKVYKVFTLDADGNPSALFVDSASNLTFGVWLDANRTIDHFHDKDGNTYVPSTKNPSTQGGATGKSIKLSDLDDDTVEYLAKKGYIKKNEKGKYEPSSITGLAYRPGWHAGSLPFFPQGGIQGIPDEYYPNSHRYNQVVFECEMAADEIYTTCINENGERVKPDMDDSGAIKTNSKGEPLDIDGNVIVCIKDKNGHITYSDKGDDGKAFFPENGIYSFATNPLTNAQDLGGWCISGSLKINRALSQNEVNEILDKNKRPHQLWQRFQRKHHKSLLRKKFKKEAESLSDDELKRIIKKPNYNLSDPEDRKSAISEYIDLKLKKETKKEEEEAERRGLSPEDFYDEENYNPNNLAGNGEIKREAIDNYNKARKEAEEFFRKDKTGKAAKKYYRNSILREAKSAYKEKLDNNKLGFSDKKVIYYRNLFSKKNLSDEEKEMKEIFNKKPKYRTDEEKEKWKIFDSSNKSNIKQMSKKKTRFLFIKQYVSSHAKELDMKNPKHKEIVLKQYLKEKCPEVLKAVDTERNSGPLSLKMLGYDPQKTSQPKAIERDERGNIIPLSQRTF